MSFNFLFLPHPVRTHKTPSHCRVLSSLVCMWACDCTTYLMTHLTISYHKSFRLEKILTIYTPVPSVQVGINSGQPPPVVTFPFLVHLAWVFKHTPEYNSYLQLYLDLHDTSYFYYSAKGHFYFSIFFKKLYLKLLNFVKSVRYYLYQIFRYVHSEII